ncbi:bifunctional hydroxymethylpyrimidine kinase/phosphomethylpyrimidine kinase, partial [Salmonella enterica subsp. enterica serovar Montevideo]|nr:bifunctional hydroxymethylpyrimidine kinase/phosphomethylpyrimidine kinase [Salmonella enterica subsp. enterica serovar Montevideo]
ALGAYGCSVITALVAQNTCGVQSVYRIEPDFVAAQLDSVLSDGQTCGTLRRFPTVVTVPGHFCQIIPFEVFGCVTSAAEKHTHSL